MEGDESEASARSPGSPTRMFTTSERLTNQLNICEIREVGELVTKTETNAPKNWKIGEEARDG